MSAKTSPPYGFARAPAPFPAASGPPPADPEVALAVAILYRATLDWRLYRRTEAQRIRRLARTQEAYEPFLAYATPAAELRAFWRSSWAETLLDFCGVDPAAARERLGTAACGA